MEWVLLVLTSTASRHYGGDGSQDSCVCKRKNTGDFAPVKWKLYWIVINSNRPCAVVVRGWVGLSCVAPRAMRISRLPGHGALARFAALC